MSKNYWTSDRLSLRHPGELFIDGRWVKPSSDASLSIISPSTEQVIAQVAAAAPADINLAVEAARRAFDVGPWPRTTPAERSAMLLSLGQHLAARAEELAYCWSVQSGIPIAVAVHGFSGPDAFYTYYANLIRSFRFLERRDDVDGVSGLVAYEPVGVVAAIAPWNHPFHLLSMKVAPALAMGATVVAKPAPESPLDAFVLAECVEEVGFPPGVFNIAPAGRETSEHLVRHPGVDKVAFTGSTAAGKRIGAICGERLARVSLELGGKSAGIVLDDASIEEVVQPLVWASMFLNGQGCGLTTRVLVSRKRRNQLAEALVAAFNGLRVGDMLDMQTQLGPLAMARQHVRVKEYIAKGQAEGAKIATGGKRPAHLQRGYFIEPTLFVDVDNSMTIAQEEIFGPVVCLIDYDSIDDAVRIANASPYGLCGGVYTPDKDAAYAIARRVRTGNFSHNGPHYHLNMPFGGFKQSGIGREGGPEGLRLYAETKTIYMRETPVSLESAS